MAENKNVSDDFTVTEFCATFGGTFFVLLGVGVMAIVVTNINMARFGLRILALLLGIGIIAFGIFIIRGVSKGYFK